MKKKNIISREDRVYSYIRDNRFVPMPTYGFKAGEHVSLGNLKNVIVIGTIDPDGRFYEVSYLNILRDGGKETEFEDARFATWLDLRPLESTRESFVINDDIPLHYQHRDIRGLLSCVYVFGVDMNPSYQRDYVWDIRDKRKLITSIFSCIDIGKFAFVRRDYGDEMLFEILDGKQRLSALTDFYEDRFSWNGKYYSDLSYRDQSHFDNYGVAFAEIVKPTMEQKLRYFLAMNTSGKKMSDEQLKKVESLLEKELIK